MNTLPRIKTVVPIDGYLLSVIFDDGRKVTYNVGDDIDTIDAFKPLKAVDGLWAQVQLDESRTVVYWNDWIDLSSDTIYEYGVISE